MDVFKTFTTHAYRYEKYYLKVSLTLINWNAFKFKDEEDVQTRRNVCVANSRLLTSQFDQLTFEFRFLLHFSKGNTEVSNPTKPFFNPIKGRCLFFGRTFRICTVAIKFAFS